MLELDIAFARGGFALQVQAQTAQTFVGVFGPSGCGKSTLLALIAGLLTPHRGRIQIGETVLFDQGVGVNLPPHRRRIGMIFQNARLFPHQSVAANLTYGYRLIRADQRLIDPDEVIALLELEPLLARRPASLSGGEAQRVALGRALLCSPCLLLCDEPLAALDGRRKARILPFLRRVRDRFKVPMLYVSHDLREILQLGSSVWVLEQGRLAAHGDYLHGELDHWLLPHGGDHSLVNVVRATLVDHCAQEGTTTLVPSGTAAAPPWSAARFEGEPGTQVLVALGADEIALTPTAIATISIQNQIEARVIGLVHEQGRVLCRLDIGVPVVAALTQKGAERLQLKLGQTVYCLFKARAVSLLGLEH